MLRPPFFWTRAARPGRLAALLRQVVHLSAVRRAVREGVRHQRLPVCTPCCSRRSRGAPSCSCTPARPRCRPPFLPARSSWRPWCRSISSGSRPTVQLRARVPCLLLLALQGSDTGRADAAPRCAGWRSDGAISSPPASRHRDVFEADQRPADGADRHLSAPAPTWVASCGQRAVRPCAAGLFLVNMAISGEWNYQGGEPPDVRLRIPVPDAGGHLLLDRHEGMARDEALTDVLFNESVFWSNLGHNLKWYFVGRYSGWLRTSRPRCLR